MPSCLNYTKIKINVSQGKAYNNIILSVKSLVSESHSKNQGDVKKKRLVAMERFCVYIPPLITLLGRY